MLMSDGSTMQISDLKKGHTIQTHDGNASKVLCLIKFPNENGTKKLCEINGMKITRKHPIMHDGEWVYPHTIADPKEVECDAVYNLVTESNHIAIVNGTPAILLGHEYTDGILEHAYLGSKKVVDDLK